MLTPPIYTDVRYYSGDPDVPHDVRSQRQSNHEVMQRLGTPVLLKRRYNIEDVENGVARKAPTMDDTLYQPTYATDALSHGTGFVSVDTQSGEWYDPATGNLYISTTNPSPGTYLSAPRHRGYGPGFLAYAILPDRPEDVLKFTAQGTVIRSQNAIVQLPWWPALGDNDLLITCRLNSNGAIAETFERYQLKMVTPITVRGEDNYGNREFDGLAGGNRYWIGQQAEMVRVPYSPNEVIYTVEVDR